MAKKKKEKYVKDFTKDRFDTFSPEHQQKVIDRWNKDLAAHGSDLDVSTFNSADRWNYENRNLLASKNSGLWDSNRAVAEYLGIGNPHNPYEQYGAATIDPQVFKEMSRNFRGPKSKGDSKSATKGEQATMANAYEPSISPTASPFDTQATRDVASQKSGIIGNAGGGDAVYNPKSKLRTKLQSSLDKRRKANEANKKSNLLDRAKERLF